MAKHKTFGSLSKALRKRGATVEVNVGRAVRKAAIIADTAVVFATPVDLGRARSSWNASIGAAQPSDSGVNEDIGGDAAAVIALRQAQEVINRWRLGEGSIFINNSVAYIIPLENGSSAQAPEGMVDQAVLASQTYLKKVKLLDEKLI